MIWLREHNLLIITPPKCGSTSVHRTLCERGTGVYVMGPCYGFIEKHVWQSFPLWAKDCRKAVLVRHPWARIASFYGHHRKYETPAIEWFDDWANSRMDRIVDNRSWFQRYENVFIEWPEATVLRIEHFWHDMMQAFGINVGIVDHVHVSPWSGRLRATESVLLDLWDYYRCDFVRGAYDTCWEEYFDVD